MYCAIYTFSPLLEMLNEVVRYTNLYILAKSTSEIQSALHTVHLQVSRELSMCSLQQPTIPALAVAVRGVT